MGLRELRLHDSDLPVLTGPIIDLDGTIAVYCRPNATTQAHDSLVGARRLQRLFDVPHGPTAGQNRTKGMAVLDDGHNLLTFDSPTDARKPAAHQIIADAYRLANGSCR